MNYEIKQIAVRLDGRKPQVEIPANAQIIMGKYATVPMPEKSRCMTQGLDIIYLIPAEKWEA